MSHVGIDRVQLSGYARMVAGFQVWDMDSLRTAVGWREWRLVCPQNVCGRDAGLRESPEELRASFGGGLQGGAARLEPEEVQSESIGGYLQGCRRTVSDYSGGTP